MSLQHTAPRDKSIIKFRPYSIKTFLLRDPGDQRLIQRVPITTGKRCQLLAFHRKDHLKLPEGCGNTFSAAEFFIGKRLRPACIADEIHTGKTSFHIIISIQKPFFLQHSRHGSRTLSCQLYGRIRIAVKNIASSSNDSAHIIFPGQASQKITASDTITGGTGDATHIASVSAGYISIGLAGNYRSIIRLSNNASRMVLFPCYISQIAAFPNHRLNSLLNIKASFPRNIHIILGIKIQLCGNLPYDSSHIGIRLHSSLVDAQRHLSLLER